ncbi:VIT family protein [uncultured Tessaracoccus sp.]|uniref:VIT1/CCC1 transporter family protein n=1 Tax=uncultured Tessaracoccus sp. TaxID=905023 RepID=UPI0025E903A6|nr:VIT family protein [uncultured Tessaracoccus sp.]
MDAPTDSPADTSTPAHRDDRPSVGDTAQRLNWLRAGILGANDGIVSTAAVVVGVAGATPQLGPLLVAGAAAVSGGAISMALGEYVSVASSSDAQRALIAKERRDLRRHPDRELRALADVYERKGLSRKTAERVAVELTDHDAIGAHLDAKLHLSEGEVVSPWHAAFASFVSFLLGALLPLLVAVLVPVPAKVPVTFVSVLLALAITGYTGARLGDARPVRAMVRVVLGGALALTATFLIGSLLGTQGLG